MLWLLWLLLLGVDIAAMALQLFVIGSLAEFEVDHVNPLDLCAMLETKVSPILAAEAGIVFLSLFDIKVGALLIVTHLVIIGWVVYVRRQRRRCFDPMVIVRDNLRIKARHVLFATIDGISFPVIVVKILLALFD